MTGHPRLLILKPDRQLERRSGELKAERAKAFDAINASGATARHDSGGRLIVIDVDSSAEKELMQKLPGARVLPVEADVNGMIAGLDETEALFVEALRIRSSEQYREAKVHRKFGESPEERELATGSCVREEE